MSETKQNNPQFVKTKIVVQEKLTDFIYYAD